MTLHLTTPFGRRPLTAAHIRAQAEAAACPRDLTVNKWTVFRNIALARDRIGVSDRSLAVLNALLTFHPETALVAGEKTDLVVFPSNEQLGLRAHGMAETTLRRHLGTLVDAGLLIRRDSPNGKRYARKGEGGSVAQAFGFDLTPIVAGAPQFEAWAAEILRERRDLRLAREAVTVLRRDAAKLIAAGAAMEIAADFPAFSARYTTIMSGLTRTPTVTQLRIAREMLTMLVVELTNAMTGHDDSENMDGYADRSERHNQNSKPDRIDTVEAAEEGAEEIRRALSTPARPSAPQYPLDTVLHACPDMLMYARDGIRSWRDLVDVAALVRSMLGISPDAWSEALTVMGPETAAVTVAAILQRAEQIKSPGGYLRTLVERKRAGRFSLGPVLLALSRARVDRMVGASV